MEITEQKHVILLHGLSRTSRCMRKMASALKNEGYIVDNVDYPSRSAPIAQLSERVVGHAMEVARGAGATEIHFVTHSMGSILVRDYMARHPNVDIGRVVMLGPPNQGSEVVDRLRNWIVFQKLNGPAGSELGTDSTSVPNSLGPVRFEAGIIAGCRSINLINSCFITGVNDGKVSVARTKVEGMADHVVIKSAHPYLMSNLSAIRHTIAFLKNGRFE